MSRSFTQSLKAEMKNVDVSINPIAKLWTRNIKLISKLERIMKFFFCYFLLNPQVKKMFRI